MISVAGKVSSLNCASLKRDEIYREFMCTLTKCNIIYYELIECAFKEYIRSVLDSGKLDELIMNIDTDLFILAMLKYISHEGGLIYGEDLGYGYIMPLDEFILEELPWRDLPLSIMNAIINEIFWKIQNLFYFICKPWANQL